MPELIVAKPSVGATVQALKAGLADTAFAGTFASSKRPDTSAGQSLPDRFIRVTRTGGGMLNLVTDRAALLVECYTALGDGERLANTGIGVLARAAGQQTRYAGAFIRGIGAIYGPTDFPDPLVPSHDRYQFTCDLYVSTN